MQKYAIEYDVFKSKQDAVLLCERETWDGSSKEYCYLNVIVLTTADWDLEDEYPKITNTSSIQYRPKLVHRSIKGYYYNESYYKNGLKSSKRVYLESLEVISIIEKFKEHLENINSFLK